MVARNSNHPATMQEFHEKARAVLKHCVLPMDDDAIRQIGEIIGRQVAAKEYVCHACAIMPDHAHLLIRRHHDRAEDMVAHSQETTRTGLIESGKRSPTHPVWTKPEHRVGFRKDDPVHSWQSH
jgi:hypothetical protein